MKNVCKSTTKRTKSNSFWVVAILKKTSLGKKKKDKQPKQEQNPKSLNMIIQADESYH